ncbi:MAG TPA: DUF2157 domain-containing protein [Polyangiaceae bacterium]|nr:DUF2157 domain-containing protein [Polyangiaceae bacterium]
MLRWAKQLETWHKAGLLSTEQVEQIHRFEASQPRRAWGVWGLLGIGATAVCTGVVSVIAANWENLGDAFKLSAYFAMQGLLGWVLYQRRDRSGPLREVLLTIFALLVSGGIGLIGQIYNLRSDGWQGLLLWLVLTLPVTALAQGKLLPHLWTVGTGTTACLWAASNNSSINEGDRWLLTASLPLAFAALGASNPSQIKLPVRLREAITTWGFFGVCAGGALLANLAFHEGWSSREPAPLLGTAAIAAFGSLAIVASWANRNLGRGVKLGLTALFGFVTLGCTLPFVVSHFPPSEVLGALIFLVIWSATAVTALLLERKRWFDLATIVIAVRFIVIYFEVFGSLAATGLGLIASGGVIIAVGLLWHRAHARFRVWLEAQR